MYADHRNCYFFFFFCSRSIHSYLFRICVTLERLVMRGLQFYEFHSKRFEPRRLNVSFDRNANAHTEYLNKWFSFSIWSLENMLQMPFQIDRMTMTILIDFYPFFLSLSLLQLTGENERTRHHRIFATDFRSVGRFIEHGVGSVWTRHRQ